MTEQKYRVGDRAYAVVDSSGVTSVRITDIQAPFYQIVCKGRKCMLMGLIPFVGVFSVGDDVRVSSSTESALHFPAGIKFTQEMADAVDQGKRVIWNGEEMKILS